MLTGKALTSAAEALNVKSLKCDGEVLKIDGEELKVMTYIKAPRQSINKTSESWILSEQISEAHRFLAWYCVVVKAKVA